MVRVDNVPWPEGAHAGAEFVDEGLMVPFRDGLGRAGVEEPQRDAGGQVDDGGHIGGRSSGENVHRVPERGEGFGLMPHDHVHAAGIARTRFVARGRVQADEGDVKRR